MKSIRGLSKRRMSITRIWSNSFSSWSALANRFNFPIYQRKSLENGGLLNVPDLQSYDGFSILCEVAAKKTENLLAEASSDTRERNMVIVFDELSDSLCKVADLAEFIRVAHPDSRYAGAAEGACVFISSIVENLNTNKSLFLALDNVIRNGDLKPMTDVDKHVAELFCMDFKQSGIHLSEENRRRVVKLNEKILFLGQHFSNEAGKPTYIEKSQVADNIWKFFPKTGNRLVVSGLFSNSNCAKVREAAYRLFLYPSKRQEDLLSDLLTCRYELAQVCGFKSYAHRSLKNSTAENPNFVRRFLKELSNDLWPRAEEEFAAMWSIKRKECSDRTPLAVWDTPFLTRQTKQKCLKFNSDEFLPFFSLGACMEGFNNLMTSLFGIHFEIAEIQAGEIWSFDIYKLSVIHESEGLLGYIYCDFFERNGKPNQDCHFTIQGGRRLPDGSYQLPIVVVMLHLSRTSSTGPILLSHSRVENLFHELGHAMHSMLGRTEYQHITGTRCSTDFAEVPSVLMEYFANDPRVLRSFAKHFKTKEPIKEDMLLRLCASKHIFCASEAQLQVFYSALDQEYHGDFSQQKYRSTTETLKEMQLKYYCLPYVDKTAWQLRFSHLVGYGSKYYSYLLSKTVASLIWNLYFKSNPFNREAGEKYRREMLAYGGGLPSRDLVANFLKLEVTPQVLSKNLINEIDLNKFVIRDIIKI